MPMRRRQRIYRNFLRRKTLNYLWSTQWLINHFKLNIQGVGQHTHLSPLCIESMPLKTKIPKIYRVIKQLYWYPKLGGLGLEIEIEWKRDNDLLDEGTGWLSPVNNQMKEWEPIIPTSTNQLYPMQVPMLREELSNSIEKHDTKYVLGTMGNPL